MTTIMNTISQIKHKLMPEPAKAPRTRMAVALAKWKFDADSPVMLMIDDFTNAWVETSDGAAESPSCDWGGFLDGQNSIFKFLEKRLFGPFPEMRTTFFTVIGKISQYNIHQPFQFAEPINHNRATVRFFRKVYDDPRFEIAYHGYNHGTPGETTETFLQEWDGFQSVDDAVDKIEMGQKICEQVFGSRLAGGKYGGWRYNRYGDESIDRSGFKWWCRDWMPKDVEGSTMPEYYEPHLFGRNNVVALPSTVHGWNWSKQQLNRLLAHKQIISIEEHMGCLRPDERVQTPNVYDDINSLRSIYTYLRGKNVWHATGSQIARYAEAYLNSQIADIQADSFRMIYSGDRDRPMATLKLQGMDGTNTSEAAPSLVQPDGCRVQGQKTSNRGLYHFDIEVQSGTYSVEGN